MLFFTGNLSAREHYAFHLVKRGDTLWSISRRYKLSVSSLQQVNRLQGRGGLRIGMKLRLPSGRRRVTASSSGRRWYTVRRGDTVWRISRRFGISGTRLLQLNTMSSARLRPGQRLLVAGSPGRTGTGRGVREAGRWRWYRVKRGDSYWGIARRLGVRLSRLKSLNRNSRLLPGRRIKLPGGRVARRMGRRGAIRKRSYQRTRRQRRQYASRGRYFGSIPLAFRIKLRWPVRGQLVERFGIGRRWISNGITIRTAAGKRIRSAGAGVIAYQGYKRGYGLMVIVRHQNNIYSVYTNMGRTAVRRGQRVSTGTVLGQSGKVNGFRCHGLHFELYYKTRPVNPVKYLS